MKIILCDDERQIHEDIRAYAAQYTQKKSVVIQLEDCYSAEELIELGEHGDAVLLDIDMNGWNRGGKNIEKRKQKTHDCYVDWEKRTV